ncbi:MAG: hypothetical protein ACXADU_05050 [Promethearchaeota archaeon]|jgi:hypothetical protein
MAINNNKSEEMETDRDHGENLTDINKSDENLVKKETIPHFFPTYRVRRNLYPIPIILVVLVAGVLSYLTYVEVGVRIDGGYISESEYGPIGGIINGIIYTALAALSAFIIIFVIKRKGVNTLMYIFGIGFAIVAFFQTWFFGEVIIVIIFNILNDYRIFSLVWGELIFFTAVGTIVMIYKYFTSKSIKIKNFIVLYIGLLIGASMGVLMPLWTTLAILVGISCWDLFAVLYKRGPIKQLVEIVSAPEDEDSSDMTEKIKSGEYKYDTSKLEIGIGDLAFYSMLTSSALVQTSNVIIMILSAIAIIAGTGITIMGLKRNKILPGLPISIFLGIGTMLLSWYLFTF